jgi:predicted 2-oxoglutarate/Fe(II)-dependent dioxygenase YbiX
MIKEGSKKEILGGVDITSYEDFLTEEESAELIKFFNSADDMWKTICFYNSYGMSAGQPYQSKDGTSTHGTSLDDGYIDRLKQRFTDYVSDAAGRPMKLNSIHAQKWEIGAYANDHSDNSELDGSDSGWMDNKWFSGLYLNSQPDYQGGVLTFKDHNLAVVPKAGTLLAFPGGIENIHSVTPITNGTRYTLISFWDFADAEYTDEQMKFRTDFIKKERIHQYKLKQFWKQGIDDPILDDPYSPIPGVDFNEMGTPFKVDEDGNFLEELPM